MIVCGLYWDRLSLLSRGKENVVVLFVFVCVLFSVLWFLSRIGIVVVWIGVGDMKFILVRVERMVLFSVKLLNWIVVFCMGILLNEEIIKVLCVLLFLINLMNCWVCLDVDKY